MTKILYNHIFTIFSLARDIFSANYKKRLKETELSIQNYAKMYRKTITLREERYSKQKIQIPYIAFHDIYPEENIEWAQFIQTKYTRAFKKIRYSILERDGFVCRNCKSTKDIAVHHIDYDKTNNDPKNLISTCRTCNNKANHGRKNWKAHYQKLMLYEVN